jgi:hypothetical protein
MVAPGGKPVSGFLSATDCGMTQFVPGWKFFNTSARPYLIAVPDQSTVTIAVWTRASAFRVCLTDGVAACTRTIEISRPGTATFYVTTEGVAGAARARRGVYTVSASLRQRDTTSPPANLQTAALVLSYGNAPLCLERALIGPSWKSWVPANWPAYACPAGGKIAKARKGRANSMSQISQISLAAQPGGGQVWLRYRAAAGGRGAFETYAACFPMRAGQVDLSRLPEANPDSDGDCGRPSRQLAIRVLLPRGRTFGQLDGLNFSAVSQAGATPFRIDRSPFMLHTSTVPDRISLYGDSDFEDATWRVRRGKLAAIVLRPRAKIIQVEIKDAKTPAAKVPPAVVWASVGGRRYKFSPVSPNSPVYQAKGDLIRGDMVSFSVDVPGRPPHNYPGMPYHGGTIWQLDLGGAASAPVSCRPVHATTLSGRWEYHNDVAAGENWYYKGIVLDVAAGTLELAIGSATRNGSDHNFKFQLESFSPSTNGRFTAAFKGRELDPQTGSPMDPELGGILSLTESPAGLRMKLDENRPGNAAGQTGVVLVQAGCSQTLSSRSTVAPTNSHARLCAAAAYTEPSWTLWQPDDWADIACVPAGASKADDGGRTAQPAGPPETEASGSGSGARLTPAAATLWGSRRAQPESALRADKGESIGL